RPGRRVPGGPDRRRGPARRARAVGRRRDLPALGARVRGRQRRPAGGAGRRHRAVAAQRPGGRPRRVVPADRGRSVVPLAWPLLLSAALFGIGLYGVLARRNAVLALMSVELMLNAANLNLVAFDVWLRDVLVAGQVFTLFTIALAAAEIGLGLAIVLRLFRAYGHVDVDR